MRRYPLFLTLLLPACTSLSPMEAGDQQFRLGHYAAALESYQQAAPDGAGSAEIEARIESARFQLVLQHARDLLHVEQPQRSLEVLGIADRLRPGAPATASLRARAHQKIGIGYAELGRDLYGAERPAEALEAFTQALAYAPENQVAQEGQVLAQERLDAQERLGEEFFFLGLAELDAGAEDRAHTAFQHAATQWGDDTRAGELLEQVSAELARRSRTQARDFLDLGLIGPAWLALRDADHLTPGVPEVESKLAEIESSMMADLDLDSAELALLGGYPDRALDEVAKVLERDAEGVEGRTAQIRREAEALEARQLYTRARACELDGLVVRAARLLEQIVAGGQPGYEDIPARLAKARQSIAAAEGSYREALEAESAGDRGRYLERLQATVGSARDFRDASQRLRLLTAKAGE
ncbi:MAG: hypothetical protein ISR76_02970 [Planctomycetes bacterium]|nr:hypothetical protein [Planctomycetota bacterium]MBL7007933.1 hypothetical protein [Planctomycetota bacterium]